MNGRGRSVTGIEWFRCISFYGGTFALLQTRSFLLILDFKLEYLGDLLAYRVDISL